MSPVEFDFNSLTVPEIRAMIARAEELMLECDPIEMPLTHTWGKTLYTRELTIPKGTMVVGKIHKFESTSILTEGEVTVLSVEGVVRLKAPWAGVSAPGIKRLVYAHEDSTWANVHATTERDIEKIEAHYIAESYDLVIEQKETQCLTQL